MAASLALTVVLFLAGVPAFFLVLVIPFIPILGRRRWVLHCPVCGRETEGTEHFCPGDGSPPRPPGDKV